MVLCGLVAGWGEEFRGLCPFKMVSSEDKNVSAGKKPRHYLNRKGSLTVNILDFSAAFLAFVSFCLMRVITFHPIRIKLCNSPRPKNQFHCQGNTLSSPLHGRGGGGWGEGERYARASGSNNLPGDHSPVLLLCRWRPWGAGDPVVKVQECDTSELGSPWLLSLLTTE
jgi:hypothetical protein